MGLKTISDLKGYICSGGEVGPEHIKERQRKQKDIRRIQLYLKLLEDIFSLAVSEIGSITVLNIRKVTPLYTTLKGICHSGFDF